MAVLLAGVTLIVYFWDTHRIGAALGVTLVFVADRGRGGLGGARSGCTKSRGCSMRRALNSRRDVTVLRGEP